MNSGHPQPEAASGAAGWGVWLRVVGCGNAFAGDDGAGLETVRRLHAEGRWNLDFRELPRAGVELMEIFEGAETVIFIDAVVSGAAPGTLHLVPLPSQAVEPRGLAASSSHGWGLTEVLALQAALHRPCPRLLLVGIELATCAAGDRLSPAVQQATDIIVGRFGALCEMVQPGHALPWNAPCRFSPGDRAFPVQGGCSRAVGGR